MKLLSLCFLDEDKILSKFLYLRIFRKDIVKFIHSCINLRIHSVI
jgi:hypothetical protein